MSYVVVGIVAVAVGLLLCLRGAVALRVVIAVWGALVGFNIGAALGAGGDADALLATPASWIVGLLLAVVFALLAYAFYAVGVILALGSLGFVLGAAVAEAFGVTDGAGLLLASIAGAIVLAVVGIALNVPRLLLAVASALMGAALVVRGVMVLTGDVRQADVLEVVEIGGWWAVAFVVLAVVGLVVQVRAGAGRGSARSQWGSRAQPA